MACRRFEGVEQRRERHDGGAVLVVVEDWDVDLSWSRSSISKQRGAAMSSRLMPPKVGAISLTALDDLSGFGLEADGEGVDAGELLEQHRLALHHRHRRLGTDVAEPEHGGTVGDYRDRVLFDREVVGLVVVPRSSCRRGRRPGV